MARFSLFAIAIVSTAIATPVLGIGQETLTRPGSAPVGHRQPRLADVPASTSVSQPTLDLENADLDRKIRHICRAASRRNHNASYGASANHRDGSPIQIRPGLAVQTCDICPISTGGKTVKHCVIGKYPVSKFGLPLRDGHARAGGEAQSRKRTMKITYLLAALLLVPSFATQARANV
jgi:hypothetical protein